MKPLSNRAIVVTVIAGLLSACGGGGDNDPNPQDAPTPASTVAEISGSAVKGTLAGADVSVVALNGSNIEVSGDLVTASDGRVQQVTLKSDPGFAINGMMRIEVGTNAESSMVCDSMACGSSSLGESVSDEALGDTQLTSLLWIQAVLGNAAGGELEGQFQANMLTTLAAQLMEAAIAGGQNITAVETFDSAQVVFSSTLLRVLGVESSNINVFAEDLVSADAANNFDGASDTVIQLSLLNAAFAEFGSASTLAESVSNVKMLVEAASGGDFDAAVAIRTQILAALSAHSVVAELGLVAEDLIDLELALVTESVSLGPIWEYTTPDQIQMAVITARASIGEGENQFKVFDGDANTKWLDNASVPSAEEPAWVQIEFMEPVPVSLIAITSANDAESRDPENFNVQASNDGGTTWNTLGEFAGAAFEERLDTQEFAFANTLPFTTYRVNITKNKGNDGLMQIAEIELFGLIFPDRNHALDGGLITARGAIGEGENELRVFDGDIQTKWLDNSAVPSAEDPAWVQIDFPEPKAVGTLAITSANDADSRDPENFNIQASNDGGMTWITLGDWSGEVFEQRFERQVFPFGNGLEFSSYRFNVTKNKGNDGLMQIAEIELIGSEMPSTDKSSDVGVLITARGAIGEGENEFKAFDDDLQTKWLDNTLVPSAEDPAWIQIELIQPAAVNMLGLTSANDADSRDPENFNVQASNDGVSWATLGAWNGAAFENRFERQTFNIANSLGFSFYRFNVTKNKGNDGLMQIAEIEFIGPPFEAIDYSDVAGVTYDVRAVIGEGENEFRAFDNDDQTKWLDNASVPSVEDPAWIQVNLPSAQTVNALALTSANDAESRDPENFNIQGSNDGGMTWVTIAEFSGESFDTRFQRQSFAFVNGRSYLQYRVNITKNKGNDGLMQIAEIELIGPQLP